MSSDPTPIAELDGIVKQLYERREAWSAVPCKERAKIVRELAIVAEKVRVSQLRHPSVPLSLYGFQD